MTGMFNKTFSSQRPTMVSGPHGEERTYPEGYHVADEPCALQQRSQKDTGGKELGTVKERLTVVVSEHRLWFECGVDLRSEDRVIVDGVTYEVIVVDPDVGGVEHHAQADLLEVRS